MEELDHLIDNYNQNIINNGYYEWNIDDWKTFSSGEFEKEFEFNEYKW